jgi:predicted transposase YbfD/YdcC
VRRGAEDDQARSQDKGHGRIEIRRIRTTTRLTGYLDWPGAKQVCLLERVRRTKGKQTTETVCAITSLDPRRASAERLLGIARGHWEIENRLHWVRDVSLGEDGCRVRTGEAPQILAALRNAGLWLMRSSGLTAIASALRLHAAKPLEALRLVTNFAPS